jgi:dipeptidyl aminopeptidase/acylaminoacyl peptidase
VFHHLGSVEMEDQISVTKELTRQFSFIDPARVGIWGWSYGGYATLKTLARDAGEYVKLVGKVRLD